MSLPNGFLDELRARASLAQVVGRKVVWDPKKSNQAKGDLWAPCPFHQEKTASFHVDDRKGFYYCFGCHQKGDAISFVRETENMGFIEAVELLAREVGMPMPARDPEAQKRADKATELAEIMEQAVQHYRLQLKTAAAAEAREYLERRGLSEDALARWEIGFAPPGWQGLWDHLRNKGVAQEHILEAGLAKPSDKGRDPYDTFRNRIMFPIRDARGRAIAFGGRAMDPEDGAKYLNSPETLLFDKGRSLFNHGPAREAAGKDHPLIIAEGYMDVIALVEAGFPAAVAPLGTAVTEQQLALIWRMSQEPIVALDGDRAGLGAARRLMDLALPKLAAGQSLRFALMPEKQDPDDVIRAGGAGAMQTILNAALPMVTLLWRRETEGKDFDSPERKAALDKALRDRIKTIEDPSIRRHYGEEIDALRRDLFAKGRSKQGVRKGQGRWKDAPTAPRSSTKTSALGAGPQESAERLREAVVLATCVIHPELLGEFESDLERIELTVPEHEEARRVLLQLGPEAPVEKIEQTLSVATLEKLMSPRHVQLAPGVRNRDDLEAARMCVAEELAKLSATRGASREVAEAMRDLEGTADEGLTWRLAQAAEARNKAGQRQSEDKTEYEIADNGVRVARSERDAFSAVLAQADPAKGGRKKRAPE